MKPGPDVGSGFSRTLVILATLTIVLGAGRWPDAPLTAQTQSPTDTIRIGALRNGKYEVTTLQLETYVARVLTGEALPGSEPAALEALAIAIRTYTLANRARHRAEGFDLCDQTHCQVMRDSALANEKAALATAGQVLLFNGAPATIYYSASCGGHTEKPSNVWPDSDDPPYLPSRPDDGCRGFPQWSTELSTRDLQRALDAAGFRGTLRNVRVATRNQAGRAQDIALEGLTPNHISGQDLRAAIGRTLGWRFLQSTDFELSRSGSAYRFRGKGAGHGVGMCVIGSTKLATAGESAREILGRYYPGATLGQLGSRIGPAPPERPSITAVPPRPSVPAAAPAPSAAAVRVPDINVLLPEGDEGERAALSALVARERDALAAALNVTAPARLTLRFHPTTTAFEQQARHPWFVLSAPGAEELHFVPLVVLRDRGVLERAVRRQLVHQLVDPVLTDRPAWVREGAAVHFAEGTNGPPARAACPTDAELLNPTSVGALGDALARARACFERQLTAGRPWKEIR